MCYQFFVYHFFINLFINFFYQLLLSTFVINLFLSTFFINFFYQLFYHVFFIFLSTFITNNLWKFKNKVLPLQDPIMHTNNSNLLQKCKKKHAQFPNPLIKTQQHDKMIRMSCIKCFFGIPLPHCWYTTSNCSRLTILYGKIQHFALRLSPKMSRRGAPATKIHTPTSPNTAPATRNLTELLLY